MRMIDKDALEEAVQGSINIMESHGISMIAASVSLAIIKGALTIDAIPVEWLRSVHENWLLTPDEMEFRDWLIERWQKEQEAQDG